MVLKAWSPFIVLTTLIGNWGLKPVKAWDHDMRPKQKLVPGGILEPDNGKTFLFFTASNKTSDFLTDGIELWWETNYERLSSVKRLVINMDNGPECSGRRTRFYSDCISPRWCRDSC